MKEYEVVLSLEASIGLKEAAKLSQSSMLAYLHYLKSNPFDEGDFVSMPDADGREYYVKGIRKHLIVYLPDHANKEVRVTSITKNKKA